MSRLEQDEALNRSSTSASQNNLRRWLLYAGVLVVVFLLGLVPMWLTARERARERDTAQAALRISTLQNSLANAAIDARRGEYEGARRAASDFFTNLRAETDRGRDSVFNATQQSGLRPVFDSRDDTITLLARSDPASADRLVSIYNTFRQALAGSSSN